MVSGEGKEALTLSVIKVQHPEPSSPTPGGGPAVPTLRSVGLLIAAMALASNARTMLATVAGLVGIALAPHAWMATIPATGTAIGGLVGILPWTLIIQRRGWRAGLLSPLALGLFAALLAFLSLVTRSFALFSLACILIGAMSASLQYYVYAGTEMVNTAPRQRQVIAAATGAGLVSAFLGPALVRNSTFFLAHAPFAGSFVGLAIVIVIAAAVLWAVPLPGRQTGAPPAGFGAVGWASVKAGPLHGMLISASGFAMMTLLMVGAPIAITHEGHSPPVVAGAIQWHMVAMFAPALITGFLMNRFGGLRTAAGGILLAVGAVWGAQHAHSGTQFTTVLILCGAGWSFMHTAGTALVVERAAPAHRVAIQGMANLVVAISSLISSFAAGPLLSSAGYPGVALAALVPVVVATAALGAVWRRDRAARPALADADGDAA